MNPMTRADGHLTAHRPYIEVDVASWALVGDEVLGTKPKRWLRNPSDGRRWLMKDCTFNTHRDGTRFRKGDDWSERIASGVAQQLGIPVARTELAVAGEREHRTLGVISESVVDLHEDGTPDTHLVLGNELLFEPVVNRGRSGYTVQAVREALESVGGPARANGGRTAWEVFVRYLILDAVIGNTDRHEENWAVIDRSGQRSLAPSFDHASCLGFQLDETHLVERLRTRDGGYTPEAWSNRARTPFAGKPHPIDVVMRALALTKEEIWRPWIDGCEDADRLVEPVWLVPVGRMSNPARDFAERVIRHNCRRLLAEAR